MSELLKIALSLSISGTLLFFVMLALKPLYKNKLSKRWQYYIWLIVIARMLIPFTSEATLVGSAFIYFENINVEITQTAPQSNDTQSDMITDGNEVVLGVKPQKQNRAADTTSSISIQAIFSKVYENLWILWAAIAFALLIRKITLYQSFVRFIKAGRTEVSDIEILNVLVDAGETIGVKRPIELFINPLISSPMLLGFFRPYIILPSIELEQTELSYIMRHELTHYKHLDMFYKWLVQITVCLHWFNPFAYLLAKEINKCCELSCDEAIIRTLDKDEKKAYGDTLLNSLKTIGNYNDKLATVTLTEGAEQLKERLEAIMKFKKKSKTIIAITLALTTMLCIGATAIGAYAVTPTTETPWSAMGGTRQPYTYSQRGYYQGEYIFELGWNLNTKGYEGYSDKAELKLSDLTTITVSFDKSCKSEVQNQEVLADLKELIERLKTQYSNSSIPLEKPLVVSVKYVGDSDIVKLAEEYYANGELTRFSAIFSSLDVAIQKEYCTKMIENGKTAFLSSSARNMDSDMIDFCLEKTYQKGKIALFSGIVPCLTNDQKQTWIARASRDGKNTFLSVLNQQYANVQNRQNTPSSTQSLVPKSDYVKVGFTNISVTGQGPIGVELVRSKNSNVTFEFLNLDNKENCTTKADIIDGTMQIAVSNYAPNGINVNFGPDYKNVVRVYIPDAIYTKFDIQSTQMVVSMPDFNAPVNVESNRAGFWLIDTTVSQGTYNIKVSAGPIYIEADTILKNITANADNGPITVRFNKMPTNLYLDSTNCGPVVERPSNWSAIYKVGSETPQILLSNTGKAVIEVQNDNNKS